MKNLYLLDAYNFLFRSYYAIGPMINQKGESTSALYGFIRSVLKLIKERSLQYLVVVFDGPQSTKGRKALYEGYKANRKETPQDLLIQLERAATFCTLAGIPHLSIPGVEADDVIGSISTWSASQGIDTYICSSDKDLAQLVGEHVFLLNIHKDNLLVDAQKVEEIFGVPPSQIIDFLALMGDASDNIPGLPGVGPKTAISLLQRFGSAEEIISRKNELKEKELKIVSLGEEMLLLSKQLATIQTQLDVPKEEPFFAIKPPQQDLLRTFYEEMHFLSLLRDLPSSKEREEVSYCLVNGEEDLEKLIQTLKGATQICIDTETTSISPMEADLVGIGIGYLQGNCWYIPLNGKLSKEAIIKRLKPLLESRDISFFGHNLKYDLHVLRRFGISIRSIAFDTLLASYLLQPQKQRHGLDPLSLELFGKVKTPIESLIGKGKKEISMQDVPIDQVANYCCEDVDYTIRLKNLFAPMLDQENLSTLFYTIELPLVEVLARMEERGIYLNRDKLGIMGALLKEEIEKVKLEIFAHAGEEFNLNSPKQLGSILFEKMGITPPKKGATGYSTSSDVLEGLIDVSPIIAQVISYRGLEKLRSTYVDTLPEQINQRTGRIHCSFSQSTAATGRLSCQDPNLQNIPVRTKLGREIRSAFEPHDPSWSFLSADYSQIELRLLAHCSEDPDLIQAFQEGEDIHTYTASLVYGISVAEVTEEMRQNAKAVNFGIVYGQQAFGLSKELGIGVDEAKRFIETYFARFKRVRDYLHSCKETARKEGYSVTLFGRKRPIPEMSSSNSFLRQAAERLAINTPLQGSAADLIKLAMLQVDKMLTESNLDASLLLQIHDELLFEATNCHIPPLSTSVSSIMENVVKLKVPLVVNVSVGKNWGEC